MGPVKEEAVGEGEDQKEGQKQIGEGRSDIVHSEASQGMEERASITDRSLYVGQPVD